MGQLSKCIFEEGTPESRMKAPLSLAYLELVGHQHRLCLTALPESPAAATRVHADLSHLASPTPCLETYVEL